MRIKPVSFEIPRRAFWDLGPDKKVQVARLKSTDDMEHALSSPHHLGYYSLRFVHSGEGTIHIDHIASKIEPNFTMLATPEQVSWVQIPEGTRIDVSVIAFNEFFIDDMGLPADIQSLVMGELSHVHRVLSADEVDRFSRYLNLITEEFENEAPHMELILAGLTRALLLHFIKIRPQAKGKRMYWNIYREFLDLLKKNYLSHHYVADYAELMSMPEKRITRACKAVTDLSASVIIQRHIGFEAKRLLYYSTNTIKEISYHLGFNDPAHFNKFFKNLYALTPGDYRKIL